jgi:hypothetical protein
MADAFLFFDLAIVSFLVFADFLIGKDKRKEIRDYVGYMWLKAEDVSNEEILSGTASILYRMYTIIFGISIRQFQFWVSGLVMTVVVFVITLHLVQQELSTTLPQVFEKWRVVQPQDGINAIIAPYRLRWWNEELDEDWISTTPLALFFALIINYYGISATRESLQALRSVCTFRQYGRLIGGSRALSWVLVLGILSVQQITSNQLLKDIIFRTAFSNASTVSIDIGLFAFSASVLIVAVVAMTPLFVHVLVTGLLVALKTAVPFLKNVSALICQRLYESEKGILTLIAAFVGAFAKLFQELTKLLH